MFFIDLWSLLCLKCCIELQQERRKEYIHVLIQSSHVEQWWLRLLTFPANQYTILISHFTYSELHVTYVGHNLKLSYYICFILNMLRIQPFIPMPVTSCLVIGCSIMWNYLFDLMWHIFLLLAVTFIVCHHYHAYVQFCITLHYPLRISLCSTCLSTKPFLPTDFICQCHHTYVQFIYNSTTPMSSIS
jgi:hypothetical protein